MTKRWLATFLVLALVVSWQTPSVALTITKSPDGTYVLTPTPEEAALLARAEAQYGKTVLSDLITNWLADRKAAFLQLDKDVFRAKFDKLSPADQKAILDKLNTVP